MSRAPILHLLPIVQQMEFDNYSWMAWIKDFRLCFPEKYAAGNLCFHTPEANHEIYKNHLIKMYGVFLPDSYVLLINIFLHTTSVGKIWILFSAKLFFEGRNSWISADLLHFA